MISVSLEYDDGMYIFQVDASNELMAVEALCHVIRNEIAFGANAWRLARAIQRRTMPEPVKIRATQGVWYTSTVFARKRVAINVVKTVPDLTFRRSADEFGSN